MKAGRELDALVAEKVMGLNVLGKTIAINYDGDWSIKREITNDSRIEDTHPVYLRKCDCDLIQNLETFDPNYDIKIFGHFSDCLEVVPFYSTNIAAAWEVVEELRRQGFRIAINNSDNEWAVELLRHNPTMYYHREYLPVSVPIAICLAALKAFGVNPDL